MAEIHLVGQNEVKLCKVFAPTKLSVFALDSYPDYYEMCGNVMNMDDKFLIPLFLATTLAHIKRVKNEKTYTNAEDLFDNMHEIISKYAPGHSRTEVLFNKYLNGLVDYCDSPTFAILDNKTKRFQSYVARYDAPILVECGGIITSKLSPPLALLPRIYYWAQGDSPDDFNATTYLAVEEWFKWMSSSSYRKRVANGGKGQSINAEHDEVDMDR